MHQRHQTTFLKRGEGTEQFTHLMKTLFFKEGNINWHLKVSTQSASALISVLGCVSESLIQTISVKVVSPVFSPSELMHIFG